MLFAELIQRQPSAANPALRFLEVPLPLIQLACLKLLLSLSSNLLILYRICRVMRGSVNGGVDVASDGLAYSLLRISKLL